MISCVARRANSLMAEFWSTVRCEPHNYMMMKYALYPTSLVDLDDARWREMKEFCTKTFGPRSGILGPWDTSFTTMSFCFRKESDRLVFLMAFSDG